MPDQIIKCVNQIGLHKKQERKFWFIERSKKPYEWTDTVPEDDPEFQGLLEDEAAFPDVSVEIPGVVLEEEEEGKQVMMDKSEVPFKALAVAVLDNADIDTEDHIRATWAAGEGGDAASVPSLSQEPCLVEAYYEEIM
jgi:hypothetical protein